MATKKTDIAKRARTRIQLVESDSRSPTIVARPGVSVELVDIATPDEKGAKIGARLCGYGSGSCLAIIETEPT